MDKQKVAARNRWDAVMGYSRAVRVNNHIFVSGTTSVDEQGNVVGVNDPYKQTAYALSKIEKAINEAGGKLSDVVRTRILTTNLDFWDEIGRAHNEFFKDILPASTIVEVQRLIVADMIVEIEAEAVLE